MKSNGLKSMTRSGAEGVRRAVGHGARDKAGWVLALVLMLVSAGVAGCGGGRSGRAVADSDSEPSAGADPFAVAQASADTGTEPSTSRHAVLDAVPADSLPPDVLAHVSESSVAPGGTVEIEARASADVVEVFLADGIGRRQSFAYDSTAKLWRARYRVPLAAMAERLGVSVTARNGLDLQSRVWVFLKIERETPAETPAETQAPEAKEAQTSG